MNPTTFNDHLAFHLPVGGLQTGVAQQTGQTAGATGLPPDAGGLPVPPRNPGAGPGLFQHLPPAAWPLASGAGPLFSAGVPPDGSAGAAPFPSPARLDAALLLTPKQRLAQAQLCVQRLQQSAGDPAQTVQNLSLVEQLAACLTHLDCEHLPQGGELARALQLRGGCVDPQQYGAMPGELAALAQNLQRLAQVHPALQVPDVRTPAELQVFLWGALERCARALQARKPREAQECLSAMGEQAWVLDPAEAVHGALFEAIRRLYVAIAQNTLKREHLADLRQAVDTLAGGTVPRAQALAASARAGDKALLPAGWPPGILIPAVEAFVEQLLAGDARILYQDKVTAIAEKFGLGHDLAICCVSVVNNADNMYDGLRALCWNIQHEVRLLPFPAGKSVRALNALADYQRAAEKNGRPIPAPSMADFRELDGADKKRVSNWVRILWGRTHAVQQKTSEFRNTVDKALCDADARETHDKYLPVRQLAKDDNYNKNLLAFLNEHSNLYKNRLPGKNIGIKSDITARSDPPQHRAVEAAMLQRMRSYPAGTVFNRDFFSFMVYGPTYIEQRLHQLAIDRQLDSVGDGGYRLSAAAADAPDAAFFKLWNTAAMAKPTPTPHAVAAGQAGALQAPDPRLAALFVRNDGQTSNAAVQAVANLARMRGRHRTDDVDIHAGALLHYLCEFYDLNIRLDHDAMGQAVRPSQFLAAPGGAGSPYIYLRQQLVMGQDGKIVLSHYEYAVPGVHDSWQPTDPDGDCLYECARQALHARGVTPVLRSVGEMRDLTAREIENNMDHYRPAIPVATQQDLELLAVGFPGGR